ncbi:MAG: hypothetical protein ACRC7N_21205 [Clostridium sp.]
MLNLTKNITLSGESRIDGQQVVYMNASVSTDGSSNANTNKTIINKDLYNANKAQCRKDMEDFDTAVYLIEDEIDGGVANVVK